MVERIVIFGATGDLTSRYLIPALARLYEACRLPSGIKITGIGRKQWNAQPMQTSPATWPAGRRNSREQRNGQR